MKIIAAGSRHFPILARSREDIERDRDQWDADNATQKEKFDEQHNAFKAKENEIFNDVRNQVQAFLSGVRLELNIIVGTTFSFDSPGLEVKVSNSQNDVHGADKSLAWDWKVSVDDEGNIKKESGSWSGLQAVTESQMGHLRETVKALEILNDIDWNTMLTVTLPAWDEYVTERSNIGTRPNFEGELQSADLAGMIGTNQWVKGASRGQGRGSAWYNIIRDSGSMYTIAELSSYYIDNPDALGQRTLQDAANQAIEYSKRIKKSTFIDLLNKPFEIMTI